MKVKGQVIESLLTTSNTSGCLVVTSQSAGDKPRRQFRLIVSMSIVDVDTD